MMFGQQYEDVLNVEEACELLRIGRNGMYTLLGSGEIQAFQYGRTWKIPKKSVEDYVLRRCKEGRRF